MVIYIHKHLKYRIKKGFKMIRQFSIITFILLASHIIVTGLNLPMPSSIVGMLILLVLLLTKAIKLNQVDDISKTLQKDITLFIIPLSIGIINSIELFEGRFLIIILIASLSTSIAIFTTALIMKAIISRSKKEVIK